MDIVTNRSTQTFGRREVMMLHKFASVYFLLRKSATFHWNHLIEKSKQIQRASETAMTAVRVGLHIANVHALES